MATADLLDMAAPSLDELTRNAVMETASLEEAASLLLTKVRGNRELQVQMLRLAAGELVRKVWADTPRVVAPLQFQARDRGMSRDPAPLPASLRVARDGIDRRPEVKPAESKPAPGKGNGTANPAEAQDAPEQTLPLMVVYRDLCMKHGPNAIPSTQLFRQMILRGDIPAIYANGRYFIRPSDVDVISKKFSEGTSSPGADPVEHVSGASEVAAR